MSEYEIDQESNCPQCGYRCVGFVDGEACSSTCDRCGSMHEGEYCDDEEEECPECGYHCEAVKYGGHCKNSPASSFYEGDYDCDFADPGGNSALRRETEDNPRDQPCPTCDGPDRLTPADVALGYQCDSCADRAEMGLEY